MYPTHSLTLVVASSRVDQLSKVSLGSKIAIEIWKSTPAEARKTKLSQFLDPK